MEQPLAIKVKPKPSPKVEKLLYVLTLRQMQTTSEPLCEAYQRLADAVSVADGWELATIILD